MTVDTKFGTFELIENYKDAFDLIKFEDRYIEEVFDKYEYIVGDVSSEILRLKGFSNDNNSKNSYKFIKDYLTEFCGINYPYYILKRVNNGL